MDSLAFNVTISQYLRTRYQILLAILPIGLMLGAFAPLWLFAQWQAALLGIAENTPVKDHPNGLIWMVSFLLLMLLLMFVGYLLGWAINAIITLLFYGWDKDKIIRVFLHSQVPDQWLNDKTIDSKTNPKQNPKWAKTRKKGMLNYIITKGVLTWGVAMYFINVVIPATSDSNLHSIFYYIWQAGLWAVSGAFFGWVIWYFSEKQFIKHNAKKP